MTIKGQQPSNGPCPFVKISIPDPTYSYNSIKGEPFVDYFTAKVHFNGHLYCMYNFQNISVWISFL